MLLTAESLLDPLWWTLWWRRRGTGNLCDRQGDYRRVLLVHVAVEVGLVTCVWSRIGQAARHSTPVSGGTRVYSTSTQGG